MVVGEPRAGAVTGAPKLAVQLQLGDAWGHVVSNEMITEEAAPDDRCLRQQSTEMARQERTQSAGSRGRGAGGGSCSSWTGQRVAEEARGQRVFELQQAQALRKSRSDASRQHARQMLARRTCHRLGHPADAREQHASVLEQPRGMRERRSKASRQRMR
jgi:hypothetical protein